MQINRSNPAYVRTLNAVVTHKQNAERLGKCAADTRYPAHQRQVFADSAAEEFALSRQAATDAQYYMDNGMMPVRIAVGQVVNIAA